jgi:hypothetical protein
MANEFVGSVVAFKDDRVIVLKRMSAVREFHFSPGLWELIMPLYHMGDTLLVSYRHDRGQDHAYAVVRRFL